MNKYDWVAPFIQGVAIVVKDNKYGAILTGGQEIIAPSYEYLSSFNDGFAQAIKNGQCVMVDLSGSECKQCGNKIIRVPKEYDVVRDFKDGLACVQKNGKWGVIDTDCKEIFPPEFFYISDFGKGTAKYRKNEHWSWGFLSSDGFCSDCNIEKEPVIETDGTLTIERYEKPNEINKDKVKRIIRIDNKGNIIVKNRDNDALVSSEYHIARDFFCGVACVQNKDGYWGAINEHGKVIIPFDYYSIQNFAFNRSFAYNKNRRLCLVSSTGSVLKKFDFSWDILIGHPFVGEYAVIEKGKKDKKDKKYGLIDKSGREVLKTAYDRIIEIEKKQVVVEINNIGKYYFGLDGKSCIIDNQVIIIPDWCLGVQYLNGDSFSALSDEKKWGLINANGETLCEPIFDKIADVNDDIIVGESYSKEFNERSFFYYDVTKYRLYNQVSGVSIPAIYDAIPEIEDNYYKIKKNGLYGIIDLNGNEIINPEYIEITYDKRGYYIVSKRIDDEAIKQGLINKHGETVFEPQFDIITIINKELFRVCKNKKLRYKWSLFNNKDQISNVFEEMGTSVKKGLISVAKYGKSGVIDRNGSIIIHSDDKKTIELPEKFSWGEDFSNGIAAVWINGNKNYVDSDFDLVINNNGQAVKIMADVDYIISGELESNDAIIFSYKNKKGLLSKDGGLLVDAKYDSLDYLNENLYIASINDDNKNTLYGIISTDGKQVLPFVFESIKPFQGKARKDVNYEWDEDDEEYYEVINEDEIISELFNDKRYWLISKGYNQYGLIDSLGSICLDAVYSDIIQFEDILFVRKEYKFAVFNQNFEMIIPFKYRSFEPFKGIVQISDLSYSFEYDDNDRYYYRFNDDAVPKPTITSNRTQYGLIEEDGYGLIDGKGNVRLDTKYRIIVQFEFGFYVKDNVRWGIIDNKFEVICEPKYYSIEEFRNGYKKVVIKPNENEGIIDKYGQEILEPIYKFSTKSTKNVTIVHALNRGVNSYGLVNKKFEFVVQPEFSDLWVSDSEKIIVIAKTDNKGNTLYGLMNENFEVVVQPKFSQIRVIETEQVIVIIEKDHEGNLLYGLMNEEFECIVKPQYSHISEFINGKAFTKKQIRESNSLGPFFKCGYLDTKGNYTDVLDSPSDREKKDVFSFGTRIIGSLKNDLLIVQITDSNQENQYCAIVNQKGDMILPFKYHSIEPCFGGTYKVAIKTEHRGFPDYTSEMYYLLDSNFNQLTPNACYSIDEIENRFIINESGLIDHHGNVLIPCGYTNITHAGKDRLWVLKNRQYGLATIDGKVLTECKYGKVEPFINGRAIVDCGSWHEECKDYDRDEYESVYKPGPFGVIDVDGNEIIPPICANIAYDAKNKQFMVTKVVGTNRTYHRYGIIAKTNYPYPFHDSKEQKTGTFDLNGYQIIQDVNGNDFKVSKKYDWQENYSKDAISAVYYNGFVGRINDCEQLVASCYEYNKNHEKIDIAIPPIYDWAYSTNIPAVIVEKNEKLGVLSSSCQELIDCSFDSLEIIEHNETFVFVCSNRKNDSLCHIVFNQEGHEISGYCSRVNHIGCGLLVLQGVDGKRVICDFKGKKLANDTFDHIQDFGFVTTEYYSYYNKEKKEGIKYAIVSKDGKYGAINNFGKVVVPIQYNSLRINENNTFVADGVLIDIFGRRIVSKGDISVPILSEYEDARLCTNGLIIVKKDNLYGCITQDNKIIIPIVYSRLECYHHYLAAAILDEDDCTDKDDYNDYEDDDNCGNNRYKYGVINYLNEVIVPFNEEFDDLIVSDYFIKYRVNKKWGALTLQGDIICEPRYNRIEYFANNLYKVGKNRYSAEDYYSDGSFAYEDENPGNSGIDWGIIDSKGHIILPLKYDEIGNQVENGHVMVRNRLHKGFIDVMGNVLLEPTYYNIKSFVDGFAIVSKKYFSHQECEEYYRYGVIDSTYREVIPCVFSSIRYEKDTNLFKTEKGLKTIKGNSIVEHNDEVILVDEKYAYCSSFKNGYAIATKYVNGIALCGLINTRSEDVLPPIFQELHHLGFGLYRYKINNKYGIADNKGNIVLPNVYIGIGEFDGNLAPIKIKNSVKNKGEIGSRLYGYINSEAKIILKAEFSFIEKRNEGYSVVRKGMDGTWGLFCWETQELKIIENSAYLGPCENGLCLINLGGVFDRKQKKTIGGKWGYIFADGREALSPIYDYVGVRSDNYSVIEKENSWGLFSLTTYEVSTISNASYLGLYKDGLCLINIGGQFDKNTKKVLGGKWGYININKEDVLPAEYNFIGKRSENYSVIRKDKSWGLFNMVSHEVKMTEVSSYLGPCNDGLCRINVGGTYDQETNRISCGKWGYLDPDKGIVIKPEYSMAKSFHEGMAAVMIEDKWGFINSNGDLIVPCVYDKLISSYYDGKGGLLKGDKIFIFDKDGKIVSSHNQRDDDDDNYGDYHDYDDGPSYDEYGGPGGYSDETIDDAFDGDPDLLWNID